MANNHIEWRLGSSQYLGEISALCFLHLPSHLSSLPYLLTGSGSQVLLYDLEAGKFVRSFQVFEGIRLHGITCNLNCCYESSLSTTVTFEVALFGEKKVKLFNLKFELSATSQNQPEVCVNLSLVHSLPRLSNWVLDVSFVKDCDGSHCLAVGCSDNSVLVWDISNCSIILEVHSPARCLLYSMKLWGDNLEALRIASGTIYNEIIIWKVDSQCIAPILSSPEENSTYGSGSVSKCIKLHYQQYKAVNIFRLMGHEGSIFRIEWSFSGSKLVSVSDDRSARIWAVQAEWKDSDSIEEVDSSVLYGHNARVWDCCITDSFIITAGEDCTCRVWGPDGKQLKMINEHIGRGIWRCLYDPISSLLVTAGFDSAIKVHQLHVSLPGSSEAHAEIKEFNGRTAILSMRIPNLSEQIKLTDSKSEYVRCLRFTSEDTLYVATNNGYLYHVNLSDMDNVKWTKLLQVSEGMPIICMDLLSNEPKDPCGIDDWVALGDGKGNMTIAGVAGDVCTPQLGFTFTWLAGRERQLLGTYWCKSLGHRFIFTADPRGMLNLWQLCDPSSSVSYESAKTCNAFLVAEFSSCFGTRIMCLDASFEDEVLVCGDLRGNLVLFPLLRDLLLGASTASELKVSPLNYFKGAHGISTISNVLVAKLRCNQIEICSTGGDGCICYLEYDKDRETLEFIGMKQVKEMSLIQSISAENNYVDDLASCNYAAGFASTDFIIWNLITEAKVVHIPCGGWRRPHSYLLGDVPETKNCFAYVKDDVIHIHRQWIQNTERKTFPKNLHMQFHGREMHTLCFVSENFQVGANVKKCPLGKSSWIATGCEDGTVRLTRYSLGVENWSSSKLLGEHVGGSAVRSICFVSEINQISMVVDNVGMNRQIGATENKENPCLLISVGAKRVLTSWLLRNRTIDRTEDIHFEQKYGICKNGCEHSLGASASLSFQWLSSDMPTKNSSTHGKTNDTKKIESITINIGIMNTDTKTGSTSPESEETGTKTLLGDKYEDDWRYLAVTAFLVKCPRSRSTICFVVVACSDATLALRALILPHRLWFDVAMLVPLPSPVLALQHVIIPLHLLSKGDVQIGSAYFVISGATDGSIAFWDLTEYVEAFVRLVSTLCIENFIDCQKRPRTGRGSQGGRWWRTLSHTRPKKKEGSNILDVKGKDEVQNQDTCGMSAESNDTKNCAVGDVHIASSKPELNTVDLPSEISEIHPIHVLSNAHQSGVNCLHVSNIRNSQSTECCFQFYVVSGGDDQAIRCLRVDLSLLSRGLNSDIIVSDIIHRITETENMNGLICCGRKQNQNYRIRFFNHYRATSAHSSAIKGIWTNGTWVFSTGLDQRVRCWLLEEDCKLTEHAHLIVSVPEPESLAARACGRNHYQIAVAGRGMQMVEFYASPGVDEGQ